MYICLLDWSISGYTVDEHCTSIAKQRFATFLNKSIEKSSRVYLRYRVFHGELQWKAFSVNEQINADPSSRGL